jgi:L-amino acid N-acyltransferase YncA
VERDEDGRLPAGIVFRRLGTPAERSRARRLLDAGGPGYRSPRLIGDEAWSGLWNLTAASGAALAAAAATVQLAARVVEVRAVVLPAGGHRPALGGRLVRELADACRAQGAERMVAGTARAGGGEFGAGDADAAAVDLLRRMGFDQVTAADLGVPDVGSIVWLALEV